MFGYRIFKDDSRCAQAQLCDFLNHFKGQYEIIDISIYYSSACGCTVASVIYRVVEKGCGK